MVDSALDIIYRADPKGFFTFVNPSASEITGFPLEELIGMHYTDFVREDYRDRVRAFYLKQMQDLVESTYLEMPIVRKDGREIWVAQRVRLILEGKRVAEAIAVSRDITERKVAEEELRRAKETAEQAQQSEKAFLLRMSHEVRTPLNAIVGMTHLLYDSPLNERQRKYLESINHASDLLNTMVTDLLHLRRMDAGEMEITKKPFSLENLVQSSAKMLDFKAPHEQVEVKTYIDPALPKRVLGGQGAINQVIFCLLSNALKFTEEGEIRIEAHLSSIVGKELWVEFKIFDTGIGIEQKYQSVIFEDFQQGGPHIHENYGGSGLGLSVVRKLVRLLRGEVRVESKPGEGSVFSVLVPLERAHSKTENPAAEPSAWQSPKEWSERRVLLVEDNPFNQAYALELLKSWNLNCDTAENGREAVEMCEENNYDLILMDVQMPVMNGHEATVRIRSMDPAPNGRIPILALSAGVIEDEQQKAEKAGMDDFLPKPFTPGQLLEKLERWFGPMPAQGVEKDQNSDYLPNPKLDGLLLYELYGEDLAYMSEMFDIFIAQTPANLENLKRLLNAGKFDQLSAFAHKVKPTFAMVGYPGPGMALETISELARTQGQDAIPMLHVLMEGVEEGVRECLEIVQSEREKLIESDQ